MVGRLRQCGKIRIDEFSVRAYSSGDLAFHVAGATLNLIAQLIAASWLARHWAGLQLSALGVLVALLSAMFAADFVSGLLHWAFDTWWSATTPVVGRMVLMVREHHIYPGRIFSFGVFHDVGTLSWITFGLTSPIYIGVFLPKPVTPGMAYTILAAIIFTVLIVFMLEFHKAGHSPCAPRWVKILQQFGFVLSTTHHLEHHRGLHNRNYCLINGHVDRILGSVGMWRLFERFVTFLTGATPARDDTEKLVHYGKATRGAHGCGVSDLN